MVGAALTVTMGDEPGPVKSQGRLLGDVRRARDVPAPSVIVVQDRSGRPTRVAYCGEVMATMAQRLGAAGYVTDGTVRDVAEVRALGLPYFASGVSRVARQLLRRGRRGRRELDGQVVRTGDVLHGDANGIVIVPREVLADLPGAVAEIRAARRASCSSYVRSDAFTLDGASSLTGYR